MDSPDSPFAEINTRGTTDATVYPEPSASNGPEMKKRKHDHDGNHVSPGSSTSNARYPELVHANAQVAKTQEVIKSECDTLIKACVGDASNTVSYLAYVVRSGQGKALGKLNYA